MRFSFVLSVPGVDALVMFVISGGVETVDGLIYILVVACHQGFSYHVVRIGGEIRSDFESGVDHRCGVKRLSRKGVQRVTGCVS